MNLSYKVIIIFFCRHHSSHFDCITEINNKFKVWCVVTRARNVNWLFLISVWFKHINFYTYLIQINQLKFIRKKKVYRISHAVNVGKMSVKITHHHFNLSFDRCTFFSHAHCFCLCCRCRCKECEFMAFDQDRWKQNAKRKTRPNLLMAVIFCPCTQYIFSYELRL